MDLEEQKYTALQCLAIKIVFTITTSHYFHSMYLLYTYIPCIMLYIQKGPARIINKIK